jgi:hypothetical protein
MARTHYRRVKINNKIEYVWDPNGAWVRAKNKWTLASKVEKPKDPEEEALKKEIAAVVKGNQYLKRRIAKIKNLHRKLYYAKVWKLTEQNDLTVLKNHDKRGFKKYHLDHIYPTSAGFKNGIPPECIADIRNLRFIHHRKNMKKRADITDEGIDIINNLLVEYKKIK